MIEFLAENIGTILVASILALIVLFVILKLRKDKKKGGCVSCSACTQNCPYRKQ